MSAPSRRRSEASSAVGSPSVKNSDRSSSSPRRRRQTTSSATATAEPVAPRPAASGRRQAAASSQRRSAGRRSVAQVAASSRRGRRVARQLDATVAEHVASPTSFTQPAARPAAAPAVDQRRPVDRPRRRRRRPQHRGEPARPRQSSANFGVDRRRPPRPAMGRRVDHHRAGDADQAARRDHDAEHVGSVRRPAARATERVRRREPGEGAEGDDLAAEPRVAEPDDGPVA